MCHTSSSCDRFAVPDVVSQDPRYPMESSVCDLHRSFGMREPSSPYRTAFGRGLLIADRHCGYPIGLAMLLRVIAEQTLKLRAKSLECNFSFTASPSKHCLPTNAFAVSRRGVRWKRPSYQGETLLIATCRDRLLSAPALATRVINSIASAASVKTVPMRTFDKRESRSYNRAQ